MSVQESEFERGFDAGWNAALAEAIEIVSRGAAGGYSNSSECKKFNHTAGVCQRIKRDLKRLLRGGNVA